MRKRCFCFSVLAGNWLPNESEESMKYCDVGSSYCGFNVKIYEISWTSFIVSFFTTTSRCSSPKYKSTKLCAFSLSCRSQVFFLITFFLFHASFKIFVVLWSETILFAPWQRERNNQYSCVLFNSTLLISHMRVFFVMKLQWHKIHQLTN